MQNRKTSKVRSRQVGNGQVCYGQHYSTCYVDFFMLSGLLWSSFSTCLGYNGGFLYAYLASYGPIFLLVMVDSFMLICYNSAYLAYHVIALLIWLVIITYGIFIKHINSMCTPYCSLGDVLINSVDHLMQSENCSPPHLQSITNQIEQNAGSD